MHEQDITRLLGSDRAKFFLDATDAFYGPKDQAKEMLYHYLTQLSVIDPNKPSLRQLQNWYEVQRTLHQRRVAMKTTEAHFILSLALDDLFHRN
ncbi:hypothetical protein EXS73_02680 [Candidatus Pacearchaeota archaeon]|nr:hypothetical protein [Candidatus Pacearchaeota archaeon]